MMARQKLIEKIKNSECVGADLIGADLKDANLSVAILQDAKLIGADLRNADLNGAILQDADLRNADLSGAILQDANGIALALAKASFIPQQGSFLGYKQLKDGLICTLEITKDAKRSHGAGRKCRCSEALVVSIGDNVQKGVSIYCDNFEYEVGKIVKSENFCEDRWDECCGGIHFFLTREEAEAY